MRTLTYFVAMTVDGFIAGPNGSFDFFPMQGDHIAAQVAERPETLPLHVRNLLGLPALSPAQTGYDTVVMGRGTYQPALDAGIAHPYAPLDTVVFSHSLPARSQDGLTITSEDPLQVIQGLKTKGGQGIWLCGGGSLAGQLVDEIDEWVVKVNPVLAGDGIRLAATSFRPRNLALRSTRSFESGVVWLTFGRKALDRR